MKQINFEYGRRVFAVTADCERCPKHIEIKELELRESSYFGTGLCAYDPKTNKLVMIATVNDVFDTRESINDLMEEDETFDAEQCRWFAPVKEESEVGK